MSLCLRGETSSKTAPRDGEPRWSIPTQPLPGAARGPAAVTHWRRKGQDWGGSIRTVAETSSQTSADAFCREAGLGELAKHKHLQEVEMRLRNSPRQCQHSQLSKLCNKHGVVESLCWRQQHVPGVFQQCNSFLSFRQPLDCQHPKLPESRCCVTRSNDVCHRASSVWETMSGSSTEGDKGSGSCPEPRDRAAASKPHHAGPRCPVPGVPLGCPGS